MKDVVHSQCKPLGEVTDYFWRKELASRGGIHVHWFAYIKDAPVYGESSNTEIALFYDNIMFIGCSRTPQAICYVSVTQTFQVLSVPSNKYM